MNSYPYIPPPFPFPERWSSVFSSSEASVWLTPSSRPFPIHNGRCEMTVQRIQQLEKKKEPSYRIEISEEWMDFVERSYKRMEEKKKRRKKSRQ